MTNDTMITVTDLRKRYGDLTAVDGISFEVRRGEIFGMVGPNGAGKTTTIECIEGLRGYDGGSIEILGMEPQRDHYRLVERVGIQLQESSVQARLKTGEALDLFGSFYDKKTDRDGLLDMLELSDKKDVYFSRLSGGQKQRLFIALALLHDPEIVFLDELTTGLDPQARRNMWDLVRSIRDRGKTVFLTTHFMEEAERLCDRVAIVDRGRIVAFDSPENLIGNAGVEDRVEFTPLTEFDLDGLGNLNGVARIERENGRIVAFGKGDRLVVDVVMHLASNNIKFRNLRSEQATLEDVFLALTGRKIRD